MPDYKIIEWNEQNFDIHITKFTTKAYKLKKYAFVSDYVRIWSLYNYGGIYMDTDVEVLKNLDRFLCHRFFTGFESNNFAVTGIMGSEKGHPFLKELLEWYNGQDFDANKLKTNTQIISNLMKKYGLELNGKYQVLEHDMHIYPKEWFCPYDLEKNKLIITDNTYTIHHFQGSWLPLKDKIKLKIRNMVINIIGYEKFELIKLNFIKNNIRDKA